MALAKVKLHVLYGIPCVGKSTAAIDLAYRRGIRTVIATDYVREIQRNYVSLGDAPALAKVTHNAWQLYGAPTRMNVERGFLGHVCQVADGIKTVAAKVVRDGFDAVVEGAHFHGAVIDELRAECPDAEIEATLLTVETADELRRRIMNKERCRASDVPKKQWLDHVDIMLVIQDFLIADAQTHNIRIFNGQESSRQWILA